MDLPKRKSPRIQKYNYGLPNYYFITICTHEKKCMFGNPGELSLYGKIAEECLLHIPKLNANIILDKYVVMPNHIHAILIISQESETKSIPVIIGQYKMAVTKRIRQMESDRQVWQRSFHDHIIRNQAAYDKIWTYIENNPLKWEEDCFYEADIKY